MSGLSDLQSREPWWGRDDWRTLPDLSCLDLGQLVRERITNELGYRYTAADPIFDTDEGNRVMYSLLHASDYIEVPALMARAHTKAVRALPKQTQGKLWPQAESEHVEMSVVAPQIDRRLGAPDTCGSVKPRASSTCVVRCASRTHHLCRPSSFEYIWADDHVSVEINEAAFARLVEQLRHLQSSVLESPTGASESYQ